MNIVADRTACIGAGQCVMVAPDLFAQDDDDGLVVVKVSQPSTELREAAAFAVLSCPTRALTIEGE